MAEIKPVAHLVWLQGRRAADDVEDYYEVARPGDKCVDGSDPFPVYDDSAIAAKDAEIAALKEELVKANRDMDMYRDHGDRKSEQVIALQQSDRRLRDALRKISEKAEDNLPMRTPGSMVHLAEVALNGGSDAP